MSKTVVLIEDEQLYIDIHTPILQSQGYIVHICHDGAEACCSLQSNPTFDLIILDHNMPNMTGIEFLQIRAKNPDWLKIPVMMCTNNSPDYEPFAVIHKNKWVVGFLPKPFGVGDLMALV